MRVAARRVAEHLRRHHDYRGAFTIDGVMTACGFRPTELNPRVGAAMTHLAPQFPFSLLHYALVEEEHLSVGAAEVEACVVARADAERHGAVGVAVTTSIPKAAFELVYEDRAWRRAAEGEAPHGRGFAGPAPTGGYARLVLDAAHTPVGPSVAPRAAAFARWADAHLGTSVGELVPAPDVTAPPDATG